ncbi:MAG TPA: type II toxin-antitoxin system VapC family toxin [Candidatus Angelobacter sp.]|nr:type II toxin-antitoxin system VapC family toxin [Candidatus Angelobacter sp.]
MSRIFWDTNLFIYLFESFGPLSKQVASLRNRMIARGDQLLTSAMTLGEILVKPNRSGDAKAAAYYQKLLTTTAVVVPFEEKAAMAYARIRIDRSVQPPDAIQLACAASEGVDLFITNDTRLHSKQISGIQFIAPLDRVPI